MRIATFKDNSRSIVFDSAEEVNKWKNTSDTETILRSECIYKETCRGICVLCDSFVQKKEK